MMMIAWMVLSKWNKLNSMATIKKLPTPTSYQHQTHPQLQQPQQITEEDLFQDGLDIEGDSLLMRFTLVFLTYASAMIVPQLHLLIALGGAITGSMTSSLYHRYFSFLRCS